MKYLRMIASFCVGMLLLTSGQCAQAVTGEIVQAFADARSLYAYVHVRDLEQPLTGVNGRWGGAALSASDTLKTVQQANPKMRVMLLVDTSGSMPTFREELEGFVAALAKQSGDHTTISVATFGDRFQVLYEDLEPEDAAGAVAAISYDAKNTRMYAGIDQALDYFSAGQQERNSLDQIIIFTDAIETHPEETVTYDQLQTRLERSNVMLHAVCFGETQESLYAMERLVAAARGEYTLLGESMTAEAAEAAIGNYVNGLYLTQFSLEDIERPEETVVLSITFASGMEPICKATAEVYLGKETYPPIENPAGSTKETPAAAESPTISDDVASGSSSGSTAQAASDVHEKTGFPVTIIVVAAFIVAVIAVLIYLRRKPRKVSGGPVATDVPEKERQGIFMGLEVLHGTLRKTVTDLNLVDEFLIGSDEGCKVAFEAEGMSARSARVFESNAAVYIEDLNSPSETYVNGMQIEMPYMLRSGDEIAICEVVFKFKF